MSERSAYEDDQDTAISPAPVEETWTDTGWYGSLDDLRSAGNMRERRTER
jgi:hypothetical protein